MSGADVKKPETREEFVKMLTEAAKKEVGSKGKPTKPTVVGTAKEMDIHRDTLYSWLKEFNVDFKEIVDRMPTIADDAEEDSGPTYLIGESLLGEGNEVAHIDLMIGDKNGPIGQAFANGMTQLSAGHTPVLAVIRPNLPPKPHTLIVPKVTIKNMEDTGKIFGPAQAAVAKAIADSAEEGIIPANKLDSWVIICSVFIHPKATDYRKIYQYNYGATKMALQRALKEVPITGKDHTTKKTAQSTQSWASKFHAYGDHHTYKLHLTHPHLKGQRRLLNNCQEATESSLKSEHHSSNATAQEASTNYAK